MKIRKYIIIFMLFVFMAVTASCGKEETVSLGKIATKEEGITAQNIMLPLTDEAGYEWTYEYDPKGIVEVINTYQSNDQLKRYQIFVVKPLAVGECRLIFSYDMLTDNGSTITSDKAYAKCTVNENMELTCEIKGSALDPEASSFYFNTPEETAVIAGFDPLRYKADGYAEISYFYDTGLTSVSYYSLAGSYILYSSKDPLDISGDLGINPVKAQIEDIEIEKGYDDQYYVAEWMLGEMHYCLVYIGNHENRFEQLLIDVVDESTRINNGMAAYGTEVMQGTQEGN